MDQQKRRAKGTGSVVKTRTGHRARLILEGNIFYGPSRAGASSREKAAKDALKLADERRPGRAPTLKDWAFECLNSLYGQRLAVTTFNTNDSIRRNQLNPHPIALKRIDQITRRDMRKFAGELVGSPAWIRRCMSFMGALFNEAREEGYIEFSPCHRLPLPAVPKRNNRVLTATEAVRLMNPRPECVYEQMLAVYLQSGFRRAELCRAQFRDLADNDEIWVRGSKNEYSAATMPLLPEIAQLLRAQPKRSEYIFSDRHGQPIKLHTLSQWFMRNRKRLGLPEEMRLHDLRGSFATFLAQRGTHPKTIQVLGRWGTMSTPMEIYTQANLQTQREALEGMAEHIRKEAKRQAPKHAGQESLFG